MDNAKKELMDQVNDNIGVVPKFSRRSRVRHTETGWIGVVATSFVSLDAPILLYVVQGSVPFICCDEKLEEVRREGDVFITQTPGSRHVKSLPPLVPSKL